MDDNGSTSDSGIGRIRNLSSAAVPEDPYFTTHSIPIASGDDNDDEEVAPDIPSPVVLLQRGQTILSHQNNNSIGVSTMNPTTASKATSAPVPFDPLHLYSSLVAGVGSGIAASITCAPLDLIRTRLQVWGEVTGKQGTLTVIPQMIREIVRNEGWTGCFRGLGATLITVPAFWGVYFPLYDDFKRQLHTHFPQANSVWIHMSSAVLAGAISDVICNPMFVVRTRLQTDSLHTEYHHPPSSSGSTTSSSSPSLSSPRVVGVRSTSPTIHSIRQTIRSLYQESGGSILIFWRGMSANLLGLSHVGIQFPVYELLKTKLRQQRQLQQQEQQQLPRPSIDFATSRYGIGRRENGGGGSTTGSGNGPLSPLDVLFASAVSKMTASLISYPHEVIRSRMMDSRSQLGFVQTCQRIWTSEGAMGFYAGLPISLIRVIPSTCITFMTYESLCHWTRTKLQEYRQSQSHSW